MKKPKKFWLAILASIGISSLLILFTNAAAKGSASQSSNISPEKNRQIVERFERGRAEMHTGDDANNCFNIFRHNSVTGEFVIPGARLHRKDDSYPKAENSLTSSGFLKSFPNFTDPNASNGLDSVLDVALYMRAGSEAALMVFNKDNSLAHIANLYMDNDRILHFRDFGFEASRTDQLHNTYRWERAILFVNNLQGDRRNPGNADEPGPNPTDDHLAETKGTYSPSLQVMLNEPMPPEPTSMDLLQQMISEQRKNSEEESGGD